jgi:hypothetical protein
MARQRGITKSKSNGDHKLADGVRKYQFDDMSDRLAEKMREIRAKKGAGRSGLAQDSV